MSQITSGIRAILSHPVIYDTVQNIMGARQIRRDLVDSFVRPFQAAGYSILAAVRPKSCHIYLPVLSIGAMTSVVHTLRPPRIALDPVAIFIAACLTRPR